MAKDLTGREVKNQMGTPCLKRLNSRDEAFIKFQRFGLIFIFTFGFIVDSSSSYAENRTYYFYPDDNSAYSAFTTRADLPGESQVGGSIDLGPNSMCVAANNRLGAYWNRGSYPNGPASNGESLWAVYRAVCTYGYLACPSGQTRSFPSGICTLTKDQNKNRGKPRCNMGEPVPQGNPINPGSSAKFQEELDYLPVGESPLIFARYYNSAVMQMVVPGTIGVNWQHNYAKQIKMNSPTEALAVRKDGRGYTFRFNGASWVSEADINDKLTEIKDTNGVRTGWKYVTEDKTLENYSGQGALVSNQTANGMTETLTYSSATTPATVAPSAGYLIKVTDSFGKALNFTYNSIGQMITMVDPANNITNYGYDYAGNLSTVSYPDDTPTVTSDNPKKTYFYGSTIAEWVNLSYSNFTYLLSGITDENGIRFATFKYDTYGKAISTEHTGGIEKYSLDYAPDGSYSSVTDPLGTVRKTNFTTILGVVKATGTDQPAGSGCAAASSYSSYDANGNVVSKTNFNSHKVCYAYDLNRNLETARVEGLASVADCAANLSAGNLNLPLRKISSQWHPDWRLLTREASPKLITSYVYNGQPDPTNGNTVASCAPTAALVDGKPIAVLCKKIEQATTDQTGAAGFGATSTGAPRIWSYTYNNVGQVLTANGPRTDVNDTTTTTYYPVNDANIGNRGNIKDVTNALGQKTTYNSYDGNGRVTKTTAPDGVVSDLTYYPRGWLKSATVTGGTTIETTSYTYYPTGLLKTVTQPDSSVLTYGYDDAHRLTSISDSLGNTAFYTLDNIGNRTNEAYKDSSGVLRRNIDRAYDALNRLETVTGADQ